MKNKISAYTAILFALLIAPLNANAGEGFFIGAGIGTAELSEDFDGLDIDSDSTAYRVVGGWRVNEYFALEGGYHNFGDFEQSIDIGGELSSVTLSADGFTLGVLGTAPISEKFALFGRAGMFFWDGNAEINNVSQATPEDTNPYFGAGLAYAIVPAFVLTGDWTRYELESANSNVFSIGFQYRFGAK